MSVPPAGYPALNLLGSFQDIALEQDPDSFFPNDYDSAAYYEPLSFAQVRQYAQQLLQSDGSLSEIPAIYGGGVDFLVDNPTGFDYDISANKSINLARGIEAVCKQGDLRIGKTMGMPTQKEIPNLREYCWEDFRYIYADKPDERIDLPASAGGHTLEVYDSLSIGLLKEGAKVEMEDLGLSIRESCEQVWEITHPLVINIMPSSNYTEGASLLVNRAYRNLMRVDPKKACFLMERALKDGFEAVDDTQYSYNTEDFDRDLDSDALLEYFLHQSNRARLTQQVIQLLRNSDSNLDRILGWGKSQAFIKKVVMTSKTLQVEATVQTATEVYRVSIRDEEPVQIQITPRKSPHNKKS